MKKTFLMLSLIALITGCEKENPVIDKTYEFNITEFVGYIDKTPEQIKSSIKYEFVNETNTLGIVELKYRLKTKDDTYAIYFKANSDGIVKNIKLITSFDRSKSDAINHVKKLTDKINQTYSNKFYFGNYLNDLTTYPGRIENRTEFWEYVADNVNKLDTIMETWLLKHAEEVGNSLVYMNLECMYIFDSKIFSIEIDNNEY